jgi:hypothetical protein
VPLRSSSASSTRSDSLSLASRAVRGSSSYEVNQLTDALPNLRGRNSTDAQAIADVGLHRHLS